MGKSTNSQPKTTLGFATTTAIADQMGMSKSWVSRLMAGMCEAGQFIRHPRRKGGWAKNPDHPANNVQRPVWWRDGVAAQVMVDVSVGLGIDPVDGPKTEQQWRELTAELDAYEIGTAG